VGEAAAAVEIDAPIDVVWGVMCAVDDYGEWNPFIVDVGLPDGRGLALGDRVVLHVRWGAGGGTTATERVTALDPPSKSGGQRALLEYAFGGPIAALGLVRGRRQQVLERVDGGRTAYRTHERLHGLLAWAAPIAKVQDGFERHAAALKARAESLA
jgi:hypothetical protein